MGDSIGAAVYQVVVEQLEEERDGALEWAVSKLKNPRRGVCKPTPWVDSDEHEGKQRIKFSWTEDNKPPIVDTNGTIIDDVSTPLYSGSVCKLAFYQKPYILRDGETYGTSLKLVGVQVIQLKSGAGLDAGDMSTEDVAALFGTSTGFKQDEPNVEPAAEVKTDEGDFDF